jgi:hypothetical protein
MISAQAFQHRSRSLQTPRVRGESMRWQKPSVKYLFTPETQREFAKIGLPSSEKSL